MNGGAVAVDAPTHMAEAVAAVARRVGRPDLAGRLDRIVSGEATHDALVVGEFKAGKSSIVNSILNVAMCPTDVDEATSIPLVVTGGPAPRAFGAVEDVHDRVVTHEIAIDELPLALANPSRHEPGPLVWVQLRLPRRLLDGGVRLIDTPGVGGLESPMTTVVVDAAHDAAAVVFAVDGTRELTATELGVLRRLTDACPSVIIAMTKIDLSPNWRTLAATLARRLNDAGLGDVPVVPVSAVLRAEGLSRGDAAMNERSGYPRLVTRLRQSLGVTSREAASAAATAAVLRQVDHWCRQERLGLDGTDDDHARRHREAAEARSRLAALRSSTAGWTQSLADQGAALTADADHDLRTRVRALTQEIEDLIERVDPGHEWEHVVHDVQHRVTEEVLAHRSFVQARSEALVSVVAQHFQEQRAAATPHFDDPVDDAFQALAAPGVAVLTLGGGALVAMKGSYGGVMMFGFVSGLVGLSMVNPITAVAGVALGRKALGDERRRQLTLRRTQGKQSLRKALDEVVHLEAKRSRDAVRQLQQELRREFAAMADELMRAADAAVREAQAAIEADDSERRRRRALLDEARRELAALRTATAAPVTGTAS